MGTAVVRYARSSTSVPGWGLLSNGLVQSIDLPPTDHRELISLYETDRGAFDAAGIADSVALADVELFSPITGNVQLICQGLNYADHRAEGGLDDAPTTENLFFAKAPSSICGPNDAIVRPRGCEALDYEIELGIVLKTDVTSATDITDSNLDRFLGALVLANDVSARDEQFGATAMQWFKGKSYRTFCPMGPVLYLLDDGDLARLYDLELTLKLNGDVRQAACTDLLIHKPAKSLAEIAEFADLRTGDCVLTGTPGGVLLNMNLKTALSIVLNLKNDARRREKFVAAQLSRTRYLQPGDVLELAIRTPDGAIDLGLQRNIIVDA